MPAQSVIPQRHAQLAAAVRAAAGGKWKPVYLLYGEPLETQAAVKALVGALVPEAQRVFNVETYDGRTIPMLQIVDTLRTPGFFAGVKVVCVRETTAFLSGEKRPDLTRALLAAWEDGRQQEAAEKLLALVALAGWSQDQFTACRFPELSKTRATEVFGAEIGSGELEKLEAVRQAALAREMSVAAFRDDSSTLLDFLDRGAPPDTVVLLTASAVDARRRAVKRLQEIGVVIELGAERERSGALARQSVDDIVQHAVGSAGKRLGPHAAELIARRAGNDLAMLAQELEKVLLYSGDRPVVVEDDVRAVFRDMGESWIFDFTGALATRQQARALLLLRGLLEQGEPALRLLAMIARELRLLLLARECLDGGLKRAWRRDLSFGAFQKQIAPQLDAETRKAFGNAHPFVLYRRFQDAARISGETLRAALVQLSDLDLRLKSSRTDPGLLLEAFVLRWCRASGNDE
jgi:DNA polymerase-3 subunit delta